MPEKMQFSQEQFSALLRLAVKNRGRDFAKQLLVETVHNNQDAFLDYLLETKPETK